MTSFLERFFSKADPTSITHSDFENFLQSEIEENLNLDYKSGWLIIGRQGSHIVNNKLDNNKSDKGFSDLARTIVGFANAEGGLLILGVQELPELINGVRTKVRPGSVEPLPLGIVSKEMIESKLRALIQFPLDDLRIVPLKLPNNQEFVCLIDIPQSVRAPHQLSSDKVYYQRRNFFTEAMEHYQINDLFGKRLAPDLDLVFQKEVSEENPLKFRIFIRNQGRAVAKYVTCVCSVINGTYELVQSDWQKFGESRWQHSTGINSVVYPDVLHDTGTYTFRLLENSTERHLNLHIGLHAEGMTSKNFTFPVVPNLFP